MFFTRFILASACVHVPSQWSLLEKREDASQIASKQAQGQKLNAIRTSVMGLAICSSFFHPTGILSTAEERGRRAREIPADIEIHFSTDVVSGRVPGGVQCTEQIHF